MAALYEVSIRTPAAGAAAAFAAIRSSASLRPVIREIGIVSTAATAASIGLIRASNTPVATTSVLGQAQDTAEPAALTNVDSGWSTAPTVGASFLKRVDLPATIGSGIVWTWDRGKGLVIPVSSSLVLWNFGGGAGPVLDLWVVWEE